MKQPSKLTVLSLILTVCGSVMAGDRHVDGFPDLPKDARQVAERSIACQHFAGEYGGSDSERDREVIAELHKLKCDRIESDLEKVKQKYRNNPGVLEILKEADVSAAA